MSGKVQKWTTEARASLRAGVVNSIANRGEVDWLGLANAHRTSINGCRFAYDRMVRAGEAVSVSELQRRRKLNEPTPAPPPHVEPDEVKTTTTEAGMESRSHGTRIRTVDDLLRHIEADMTRFEIDKSEATKYEMGHRDADGNAVVTELHRVFVRLKPKTGPTSLELVEGIIEAAFRPRRPLPRLALPKAKGDLLHVIVIADPHIGKYAWGAETGWGDYDITIATELIRQAAGDLLEQSQHRKPARRLIACLGDWYHYDNPQGTTTAGTAQDRDGRVQKMIDAGADALFDVVEASAATCQTDVVIVPGNHDEVLSRALQRTAQAQYRNDKRVSVDLGVTYRKKYRWGSTLLGLTHGDKARKQLPGLMAREWAQDWGETIYREIHTGHLHGVAAIESIEGVLVRTGPSLSEADNWHSKEGYVGNLRAMEGFYYSAEGAPRGSDVSAVTMKQQHRRAA